MHYAPKPPLRKARAINDLVDRTVGIYRSENPSAATRTSLYRPASSACSGVTEPSEPLALVKNCHLLPPARSPSNFVIASSYFCSSRGST